MILEFTVNLIPRTKKNNMQIVKNRSQSYVIQGKAYRQFEKDCLNVIPHQYRLHIQEPCIVYTKYYMPDKRRVDISNLLAASHDILVKAGVLEDDNYKIIPKIIAEYGGVDRENPRTEYRIEVIK